MSAPTRSQRPWRRAAAWLAALAPFFYLSYGLANHFAAGRESVPSIVFDWEAGIPFWAWTIFPYWSINLFYGLSLFLCRTRHELDRHGCRLLTAQVVAVSFFIAAPLAFTFGQPPVDGAAGWLFAALRGFDKPFNQAPSLHIALAVILWDLYRRLITAGWARAFLHVWALLICASVLTTYQHHFIDIPTGALLGVLCVWVWPLERKPSLPQAYRLTPDPQRRRLAIRYAMAAVAALAVAIGIGGTALWLCWMAVSVAVVAANYAFFGKHGFQKRRDGRSSWAAVWLMAPYRWGAWLNSRWWTRQAQGDSEIVPGVWLGRVPAAGAAPQAQPWASALDLTAELDTSLTQPLLALPMLDLVVPDPATLRRAAMMLEAQRNEHGSVLVFCALGYSRSAAAVATWLLLFRRADHLDNALALIRRARPHVVLHSAHQDAVARAAGMAARAPFEVHGG